MIRSWASLSGSIGPADFGHPQRNAVVGEDREGVAELVAVERPLRLPHDHGLEPATGIGKGVKQSAGLGPALGRDGTGLIDVEELGDDPPAVGRDQCVGAGDLPSARGLRVLVVLGGHPSPER